MHTIGDYVHSDFGKALILDHHVNRPNNVALDFGSALEKFFLQNPTIPGNPALWGASHAHYESKLLDIYGPARRMTDPGLRYKKLKVKL